MNELATLEQGQIALLDALAVEARTYAENAYANMMALGRVLSQAKEMLPHGEFLAWVEEKVGISSRYGEHFASCYRVYGDKPEYAKLGKSKLIKMLALPAGTQDDFIAENDVENMSVREVEAAVKKVREEARKEIEKEREARRRAEDRAEELANRPSEIPDDVAEDLRRKDADIARLSQQATEAVNTAMELRRENTKLRRDNDETEALLTQTQELYDQSQRELHSAKSAMAREEDDGPSVVEFTIDSFDAAVGEFMRSCARLPYMGAAFAVMDHDQRQGYESILRIVEGWCASSREAINTVSGGIIIE